MKKKYFEVGFEGIDCDIFKVLQSVTCTTFQQ